VNQTQTKFLTSFQIISNSNSIQAIQYQSTNFKILMVAIFSATATSNPIGSDLAIVNVSAPSLLVIRQALDTTKMVEINAANPVNLPLSLVFSINQSLEGSSASGSCTKSNEVGWSVVKMVLAEGVQAGSTTTMTCNLAA